MSKYDRMRPAVKPANWMKPRSTHSVSATAALLSAVLPAVAADHCAPTSMYDRRVPYSVCVRRSTLTPLRTRKPKLAVSVRVWRPCPASALPAPIGTSLPLVLNDVWTRTNEPIFKHVSVPGTYQKPAPYRLQTFTYSTGLAFTGRSAACAPATATRPAAEPRRRLFTIFMLNLQLAFGRVPCKCGHTPGRSLDPPKPLGAVPRLMACPQKTRRLLRHRTPNAATRGMPPSVAVNTLP